jgi:hypothetical protein
MKGFQMTKAEFEAHQRKHGFITNPFAESTGVKQWEAWRDGMNQTEREFSLILEARKRRGEIDGWAFESVKLRLADGCWYTPDFFVWGECGNGFYEVKGRHIWDDAKVKFKVAREEHKWATFEMWRKIDGRWTQIG